jgi:nucleotide-binding universal stress UspA family protein
MNINKVLVPVDFSPPSTLAVNYGIALARKLRAKLSLLHVVESPSLLYRYPHEVEKLQTQRKNQAELMLTNSLLSSGLKPISGRSASNVWLLKAKRRKRF